MCVEVKGNVSLLSKASVQVYTACLRSSTFRVSISQQDRCLSVQSQLFVARTCSHTIEPAIFVDLYFRKWLIEANSMKNVYHTHMYAALITEFQQKYIVGIINSLNSQK